MRGLFLLFIVVPIVEMMVLIQAGKAIGTLPTIGLVLLTAVIGMALLRRQGLATLTRARARMDAGDLPAQEMVEGIFLAVGGALLLTPGFVTDAFGFFCLIPGLRQLLIGAVLRRAIIRTEVHSASPGEAPSHSETIEGEYRREDRDPPEGNSR